MTIWTSNDFDTSNCEHVWTRSRFVVIGGGAPQSLKKLASDKIVFTDFIPIKEVAWYYQNALCMVAPLFHGAGIKIKVLEAMSAGLPVLTNRIGIEGVGAND